MLWCCCCWCGLGGCIFVVVVVRLFVFFQSAFQDRLMNDMIELVLIDVGLDLTIFCSLNLLLCSGTLNILSSVVPRCFVR